MILNGHEVLPVQSAHPCKCFWKKEGKYSSRTVAADSLCVFSFVWFPTRESTQLGPVSGKWDLA